MSSEGRRSAGGWAPDGDGDGEVRLTQGLYGACGAGRS